MVCLSTAVERTFRIYFSSNEKVRCSNEEGNILVHGFMPIALHFLNLGHSVYYTEFVPSFKMFEVHLRQSVSFWQRLNMFISRKN